MQHVNCGTEEISEKLKIINTLPEISAYLKKEKPFSVGMNYLNYSF